MFLLAMQDEPQLYRENYTWKNDIVYTRPEAVKLLN